MLTLGVQHPSAEYYYEVRASINIRTLDTSTLGATLGARPTHIHRDLTNVTEVLTVLVF